jgi:hypothetical protein
MASFLSRRQPWNHPLAAMELSPTAASVAVTNALEPECCRCGRRAGGRGERALVSLVCGRSGSAARGRVRCTDGRGPTRAVCCIACSTAPSRLPGRTPTRTSAAGPLQRTVSAAERCAGPSPDRAKAGDWRGLPSSGMSCTSAAGRRSVSLVRSSPQRSSASVDGCDTQARAVRDSGLHARP